MKTTRRDEWRVTSGETDTRGMEHSRHPSPVTRHASAFTLIELLTVIAIIGALAALLFPVVGRIKQQQYLRNATAEMEQLETAIERYKAAYGFYPPDNPCNPLVNQLYFELLGTTVITNNGALTYQSLDDPTIEFPVTSMSTVFNTLNGNNCVGGFMNCTRPGSSEDVRPAQNFLSGLKSSQLMIFTNNFPANSFPIKLLVTAVTPPGPPYCPLGPNAPGINPWRYNASNPTNNPGAYDLWIQLPVKGTNNAQRALICNWNRQMQWNSPLP